MLDPKANNRWLYGHSIGMPVKTTGMPNPIGKEAAIKSVSCSLPASRMRSLANLNALGTCAYRFCRSQAEIQHPEAQRDSIRTYDQWNCSHSDSDQRDSKEANNYQNDPNNALYHCHFRRLCGIRLTVFPI